ncbi:type III secretion system chaperone [Achromobacter sp. NCFB-sbj8-Ac1-l]|uniref:type III secretion system chaperone n=1 Tax=unclassified Achromobacter TaxID=2626865 RepID=UPI004046FC39
MNPQVRFEELLAALAQALGQPSLPVGQDGTCTLIIDGRLAVNLAVDPQGRDVLIFAPLGHVPAEHRAAVHVRMLQANGAGASPYTLGLTRQGDTAILSARRPLAEPAVPDLADGIAAFAQNALRWQASLQAPADDTAGAAPAPGAWMPA